MILLLSTTTRETPRAMSAACEAARSVAEPLRVAFVLDPAALERIRERLVRTGFGAEADSAAVEAMAGEYRRRAEEYLETATGACEGVPIDTRLLEGDFVETALGLLDGASRAFVSRKRRSQYSRILFEGPIAALMERAPCPVEVVEDD